MLDPLEELRAAAEAALPPLDGELVAPGLREPVEVLRDRWGIPYLTAASLDDLWFAQGFVQASERLFQIDLALRASNGRLAELFSEPALPSDRFARTVGFNRIGAAEAERWSPASTAMYTRFIEGVRSWAAVMPAPPVEHALLAIAPELPEDLGAWAATFAYVAWGLSGNWDSELLRVHLAERFGADAVGDLLPPLPPDPPSLAAGALGGRLLDALPRAKAQGSNEWVVAGSRTASGLPLLANDPHLLVQQPGAWFELGLRAPGYEARGVAFSFAPGIVIGATPHHAWGITNVSGDVQDLFVERLNEDGTAAEHDGAWEPLRIHRETIAVRGGEPIELEVRETRHGPILDSATVGVAGDEFVPLEETYALRWAATDGLFEPSAVAAIAQADSFEGVREALRGLSCPGQNVVYADVEGTIGYQCTGRYPVRRAGDGTAPVPGWTSEHEWDGWIAFEDLPWCVDPERGYIVTANNRIHDASYPHLIGHDFHTPYRARRIEQLLTQDGAPKTVEAMAGIQLDTVSLPARVFVPRLLAATEPASEGSRAALERLGAWDGDVTAASGEAALLHVWVARIAWALLGGEEDHSTFDRAYAWRETFACEALPAMLEAAPPAWTGRDGWSAVLPTTLEEALAALAERLGPDVSAWRWGSLHAVRFAHPLARMPGFAPLFMAAASELGGDEQTVLQGGYDARDGFEASVVPSWRSVVDLGDLDASIAVLPTGQSGDPVSPHWADQAELWASGRYRPAPVTRAGIEAAAVRTCTLLPG